jgi:hypothetical protein
MTNYPHKWEKIGVGERCANCGGARAVLSRARLSTSNCSKLLEDTLSLRNAELADAENDLVLIEGLVDGNVDPEQWAYGENGQAADSVAMLIKHHKDAAEKRQERRKLPQRRQGYTQKVTISGTKLFLRVSEYPDGTPGEIFVNMYKEGASFGAMLNAFCIAISIGLQYGVPLEKFVDLFVQSRFQPDGVVVGHDKITSCMSALDFIFKDLALSYLGEDALPHGSVVKSIDSE